MTTTDPLATVAGATSWTTYRQRGHEMLHARVDEHVARLRWDADQIRELQTSRLHHLLGHARAHAPFHADRLAGVDIADVDPDDLRALPVMTKADLMEHFDAAVTDRRLTRALAERTIEATGDTPVPLFDDYLVLTSGGSSGARGIFVAELDALVEFSACIMRPAAARVAALGPLPHRLPAGLVAAASPIHATGSLPAFSSGGMLELSRFPVTLPLEAIVAGLNELRPPVLYGYPSVLARLAREQEAGRLDLSLLAITCTSETLRPDVRDLLQRAFGVPPTNTFGSTELLVGHSEPGDRVLSFASDACIVEPVDEHDRPVPVGVPSTAILVTNLVNTTQPLIRYRMDDRFVVHPPAAEHGHLRAEVDGRASEVLHVGDLEIHPHTITTELAHTPAIVDHQIREGPAGIDIDVVVAADIDLATVTEQVARGLARAGVRHPVVHVRAVPELPRDPATGKVLRSLGEG